MLQFVNWNVEMMVKRFIFINTICHSTGMDTAEDLKNSIQFPNLLPAIQPIPQPPEGKNMTKESCDNSDNEPNAVFQLVAWTSGHPYQ
jgi:hypothetical protein